jgi:trans-aconitate methyltransferase
MAEFRHINEKTFFNDFFLFCGGEKRVIHEKFFGNFFMAIDSTEKMLMYATELAPKLSFFPPQTG